MDFVHDQLFDGRRFRILTVVDQWSRTAPIVEVALGFSGKAVAEVLDRWIASNGKPISITVDHGTEFTSKALDVDLHASLIPGLQGYLTHRQERICS